MVVYQNNFDMKTIILFVLLIVLIPPSAFAYNQTSGLVEINYRNNIYPIPYNITNGVLSDLTYEPGTFNIQIIPDGDGSIELIVPRIIVDPKDHYGEFNPFVSGTLLSDEKINCDSRKILISFDRNDSMILFGSGGSGIPNLVMHNPTDNFEIITDEKVFMVETHLPLGSVCNVEFSQYDKSLSFPIRGVLGAETNTFVTIPNELLWGNYTVLVDGVSKDIRTEKQENSTRILFDVLITQDIHQAQVIGTHAIPEFPVVILLIGVTLFTMLVVTKVFAKNKILLLHK